MRIVGIKNSRAFRRKRDVLAVIKTIENYFRESLQDYVPKIVFCYDEYSETGCFYHISHEISINVFKILHTDELLHKEYIVLAHELIHAIQKKQGRLPAVDAWAISIYEYYKDPQEFEAQDLAVKLFGDAVDKKVWKKVKSKIERS